MLKIPFAIPTYEILFTRVPPDLDGWLESPCWKGATWIDRFISVETDRPTGKPTSAAMLWDRRRVYIAFRCAEGQSALLRCGAQSPEQVWNDDCVEIYLNPGLPGIETFAFAVNPAGRTGPARRVIDDPGWGTFKFLPEKNVQAAARITSEGWQLEVAIPFEIFGVKGPEPGEVWRGNLCRNDKLGFQWTYWALGKTPGYVYSDGQLFPYLKFSRRAAPCPLRGRQRSNSRLARWPGRPRFDIRGIMYDTSRGSIVLSPGYWKKMLPLLASQGCNTLLMYFENHMRYPSHPEFAPAGSWTLEDLSALQRAAGKYGIDVIPSQTSLGHCPGILNHPKYRHLAEEGSNGYQFCAAHPETGRVLEDIFSDLCRNSRSAFVNINADESGYLGLCPRCRREFPAWSPGKIYRRHIMRLHDVITSHGKRMMMWDDMLWTFPDALEGLPRDIILLDWHYTLHRRYPSVDVWRAMGFDVVVCPGMYMVENAFWFADYGAARGAMGLINTLWESHSLPFGHYWPHLAATSWATHAPAPADAEIGPWYEQAATMLFGSGAERLGRALAGRSRIVRRGHKPPAVSPMDAAAERQVAREAELLLAARRSSGPAGDVLDEFAYSSRLLRLQTETSWRAENRLLDPAFRKWAGRELECLTRKGAALWRARTSCVSQRTAFFERHDLIRRLLAKRG